MLPNMKMYRKILLTSQLRNKFPKDILIDGYTLNLEKLSSLGTGNHKMKLSENSVLKINSSRKIVESIIEHNTPVYGFNTGFGHFSNICISNEHLHKLQYNLIRSHATGTGDLINLDQTRRIAVLRVNTLARGHSGISLDTLNSLIKIINSKIVPFCPSQGTVGASGDLVPLAHIAMGLIGEGLLYNPRTHKYEEAMNVLKEYNIEPAILKAKEGLSLINGTQFMTGIGSVALEKSINLIRAINAISGLSFTALKGNPNEFDQRIGEIRSHPGQIAIAEIMRKLIPIGSILINPYDVQSSYSLRCIPQVHGPVLEMILHIKDILEREMNSTTDNPLIFEYGVPNIISNGNFHGEIIAKALDVLAIYVHELGNISYPRIMRLLNNSKNQDLNTFLTYEEGLCSGMMTYENLAAALVSENKVHCSPASIDSLSTCADKEDHVSMGGYAARKAVTVAENVGKILAVELMAATKAIKMRQQMQTDFKIPKSLERIYENVIKISPPFFNDRYSKHEFEKLYEYIMSGELWEEVLSELDINVSDIQPTKNISEINQHEVQFKEPKKNIILSKNDFDSKSQNEIKIKPIPTNEKNHISYTKERSNQIQIGQLQDLFIRSEKNITIRELSENLSSKIKKNKNVISLLDLSQDDIGSRANFGRGHSSLLYPFKPFLEKLSNHQLNKLNSDYINSLYLIGSLELSDLLEKCHDKNPNINGDKIMLTSAVKEVDRRTQEICNKLFELGSKVICLNGDNNNTLSLIGSIQKSFKKKVVLIYLDIHSDCRDINDGPHSGNWVTQAYKNNWIEKSYLIGFSELHNNENCLKNLIDFNVEFKEFTCQKLQSGENTIKSSVDFIINSVKTNYNDSPIVLCVDGDSVCGLPASAGNNFIGFPYTDVYPLIYRIAGELDVKGLHIAELKPSLEPSKESAVGEFLVQSTYLFLKGSLKMKK